MELIPNYSLNGFTNDGNTVLAVRDDSTSRIRLDATYTRKYSSFNVGTGVYSVPTVDTHFRRDVADSDGNPTGQRASASVGIRLPVRSSEADVDALILDLRAYVNDESFKDNIVKQLLPSCCASSE